MARDPRSKRLRVCIAALRYLEYGCFIEQVYAQLFHCRWFRHAALVEKRIATFIGLVSQGPAHAPPLLR